MREQVVKLLILPPALVFSCLLAGTYGAIHNQISYTVAPQYFHEFKFIQFHVSPDLQNRLGAAIIGWKASWWMGLIIAIPIYTLGLFVKGIPAAIQAYITAGFAVLLTTLVVGLLALLYGYMSFTLDTLPIWMEGYQISNPVAFARGGNMHNFSYLGGVIGMIIGSISVIAQARASRRKPSRK